jgi:hypothetical protein
MLPFLALTIVSVFGAPTRGPFEGHPVLRFNIQTDQQLAILRNLTHRYDLELDLWSHLSLGNVDIRVPPSAASIVAKETEGIPSSVWIENVQSLIDEETAHSAQMASLMNGKMTADSIFKDYQSATAYADYLSSLPGAREIILGYTFENRPIRGVKFGTGSRAIFFNGGVHAREWVFINTN